MKFKLPKETAKLFEILLAFNFLKSRGHQLGGGILIIAFIFLLFKTQLTL